MPGLTVIAVDWSGAKRPKGIWLAAVRAGSVVESRALRTREEAVDVVLRCDPPLVAGFDFSFGGPAWFARSNGCTTVDDVWKLAARDGERWLAPTPPFWRDRCEVPAGERFRLCEERLRTAKSVFQLVGNGQVGAGSVRGMPLLTRLRDGGCAIWPFNPPGDRTIVEIYPTVLRPFVPDAGPFDSNDERDAVCSALAMWQHRTALAALTAATDDVTRLEGDVWTPT